jgi:hypothetical protein
MLSLLKPREKSKPEMLFYEIWKISEGSYTQEQYDDDDLWEKYKESVYKQFEFKKVLTKDEEEVIQVTHPSQKDGKICPIGQCLCTQCGLNLHCVIKNKKTNETCWVGSRCINRFLGHIAPLLHLEETKLRNREIGNVCHYCDEPLVDLRKKYQKNGYCNSHCSYKNRYCIPFGKHKGKRLVEFMMNKEGNNWVTWVRDQIKDDPTAFGRYDVFREILEEVEVDGLD